MTTGGTQVFKQNLYVLRDGRQVVDWGDGEAQDLITGEFLAFADDQIGHGLLDRELDHLVRIGRVVRYDAQHAYLGVLPEGKRRVLD